VEVAKSETFSDRSPLFHFCHSDWAAVAVIVVGSVVHYPVSAYKGRDKLDGRE